jgi:nucleoid-associated protein YgaU
MTLPSAPTARRYATLDETTLVTPDGRTIVYLRRRLVPPPERFESLFEHRVTARDRLDNLAARYYRDPEIYWLICDANNALRPEDLERPGRVLRITMPEGVPGPRDA